MVFFQIQSILPWGALFTISATRFTILSLTCNKRAPVSGSFWWTLNTGFTVCGVSWERTVYKNTYFHDWVRVCNLRWSGLSIKSAIPQGHSWEISRTKLRPNWEQFGEILDSNTFRTGLVWTAAHLLC